MAAPKKPSTGMVSKFNKSVDIGPQDYQSMDLEMAQTIQNERIRRQMTARMGIPQGKPRK